MSKKLAAEFIGTFWLVLGGCGSAVLAAAFPQVGIGLAGVSLAFGLTVLTMAYAIGHISGCHLNLSLIHIYSIGKHVIYAALDPATAILEVAVHKGFKVLNTVAHNLYSFTITDPSQVRVVQPGDVPNPHWLHPIPPNQDQQDFGDLLIDCLLYTSRCV